MTEKICYFDLDNTLNMYTKAMTRDLACLASPGEDISKVADFHYDTAPGYIQNRMDFIRRQPDWWLNLELNIPIYNTYLIAKGLGFKCSVLTIGPRHYPSAWTEKMKWVDKWLGNDVDIHVVRDKGLLRGDLLVDDYPRYCNSWLDGNPTGKVLMPNRAYNSDYTHNRVVKFNDVDGGHEVVLLVNKVLKEVLVNEG